MTRSLSEAIQTKYACVRHSGAGPAGLPSGKVTSDSTLPLRLKGQEKTPGGQAKGKKQALSWLEPSPQPHIPSSKGRGLGAKHSPLRNFPLPPGAQEEQKWPGRVAAGSALQLVCDGEDSLQDRHETGYLAKAAAACHLRMHRQALFKVACIHTSGNVVEPGQDVR